MQKYTLTIFIFISLSQSAWSQIEKNNWLVGGSLNVSSSSTNISNVNGVQKSDNTNIGLSPKIGYFLFDRFAGGIKCSVIYNNGHSGDIVNGGRTVASGGYGKNTRFDIGPFIKYYALPDDKMWNMFFEADYQVGSVNFYPNKGTRNGYSFYAGPAFFFNPSVALECTIGYSFLNESLKNAASSNYTNKTSTVNVGIGLQIHLEK